MSKQRRSAAARLGIVALNLLLPGLGWMRLGRWRPAALWFALYAAISAALLLAISYAPPPDFRQFVAVIGFSLASLLILLIVPMIANWRGSAHRRRPTQWWMRWYSLTGLVLLATLLSQSVATMVRSHYRTFSVPGESMLPTVAPYDRFVAAMRPADKAMRRGDLVLVQAGGSLRLYRLIGLPGDRIAIEKGIPIVNGARTSRLFDRPYTYRSRGEGPVNTRRFIESLPGAAGAHAILDMETVPELDEMSETTVPAGRVFLMGDNRDRAADSRVPRYRGGIDLPSTSDIKGVPLFIYWSDDRSRIGRSFTN